MAKSTDIPAFGPLQGVKVISSGTSYAGPFAGILMAEMGADVIKMESTKAPDLLRGSVMTFVDNRNQRDIALDIATPEGKEIFLKMLEDTDILIESSKGGSYDKMGLSDEVLWGVNKKLVIVHVSAYGQKGDPGYVKKAGLDGVAQAFSGYMYWNGEPEKPWMSSIWLTETPMIWAGLLPSTPAICLPKRQIFWMRAGIKPCLPKRHSETAVGRSLWPAHLFMGGNI